MTVVAAAVAVMAGLALGVGAGGVGTKAATTTNSAIRASAKQQVLLCISTRTRYQSG